jgi:hypothetical protein
MDWKKELVNMGLHEDIIKLHPENDPNNASNYKGKILGSYVGSDEFVVRKLDRKIESLHIEANVLRQFPNIQGQHLILRYCYAQKINYLQRTTPPYLMQNIITEFDSLKRYLLQYNRRRDF